MKGGVIQRLVAAVRGQAVVVCGRCGWQGRQHRLRDQAGASRQTTSLPSQSGVPVDLAVLDGQLKAQSEVRARASED